VWVPGPMLLSYYSECRFRVLVLEPLPGQLSSRDNCKEIVREDIIGSGLDGLDGSQWSIFH